MKMKKNGKNQKSKVWLFLFGFFAVMAVTGGVLSVKGHLNRQKANKTYEELQAFVNDPVLEGEEGAGFEEIKIEENAENESDALSEGRESADILYTEEMDGETVSGKEAGIVSEEVDDGMVPEAALEDDGSDTQRQEEPGILLKDEVEAVLENRAAPRTESSTGSKTSQVKAKATAKPTAKASAKPAASAKPGTTVTGKKLDWDALHKENPDIYAWISVPGTTVDYPVLQHPTNNTYYLNRNIDGSKGYPGCIYTENYNSKSFTDLHTVLYGHNLKDKTMFSSLHNFAKNKMVQEPHYIYIYTESGDVYTYEIFAAYEFPAIHLLVNYDLTNEYVYEQYIKNILNMDSTKARVANIRHDIEVTKKDKIITLSTCTTDHDASLRFLVVGVLQN